ncbi:MAG: class II aldolase/adducin family protein [Methylophilaceae bacterium]|nr:class II aldolase/adducin family protein [Methylophilaceae bacterium]
MSQLRERLLAVSRRLIELGLNRGTAGNVSVRDGTGFLITPSGMPVEEMTPHDMVQMEFDGRHHGTRPPSSEWRFHRDILQARPEVGAIIHTHAMFATTLACLRRDIPPFHYMIALAGGDSIRCAPYATFGTQALSDAALTALANRNACLLANHGMIALGRDLDHALAVAVEVETLCEQYWRALQIGEPVLLTPQEMADALEQFKGYGRWKRTP